MKIAILATAAALSACAAAAQAQSQDGKTSILCLEPGGQKIPATCQVQASRLDPREDICTCPLGGERVVVPVCGKGESPPPESAAYERARSGAITNGSLVGQSYKGKPMCVACRNGTDR